MSSGPLIFVGILFTLASSFWGLILLPQMQLGRGQPVLLAATGDLYPAARPGMAQRGAQVYRANGCVECHTQQVRPRESGSDLDRPGWGQRRTVAQDYLRDYPVQLGRLRIGPDLTNIGVRQTNATWHLTHLYNAKLTSPGSMMPPYAYLFTKHTLKPGQMRSEDSLPVEGASDVEVLPTEDARALAAYLLSLKSEVPLFEAPLPRSATNATPAEAAGTNQAAITSSPATATLPPK